MHPKWVLLTCYQLVFACSARFSLHHDSRLMASSGKTFIIHTREKSTEEIMFLPSSLSPFSPTMIKIIGEKTIRVKYGGAESMPWWETVDDHRYKGIYKTVLLNRIYLFKRTNMRAFTIWNVHFYKNKIYFSSHFVDYTRGQ